MAHATHQSQLLLQVIRVVFMVQVEPEQPDTRDWRSRTQLPAQPEDQQVRLPQTDAKAQTQQQPQAPQTAPQAQAPQRQKPTAQQQLSGAPPKETVCLRTVAVMATPNCVHWHNLLNIFQHIMLVCISAWQGD